MKNILSSILLAILIGMGINQIIFFTLDSYKESKEQVQIKVKGSEKEDRTVFSSGIIDLEVISASVGVEFVDSLGENVKGQYDPNERIIRIKCPEKGDKDYKIYGTIAHESTHYGLDTVNDRKINDGETLSYIVGYVTEEIVKMDGCNFNKLSEFE